MAINPAAQDTQPIMWLLAWHGNVLEHDFALFVCATNHSARCCGSPRAAGVLPVPLIARVLETSFFIRFDYHVHEHHHRHHYHHHHHRHHYHHHHHHHHHHHNCHHLGHISTSAVILAPSVTHPADGFRCLSPGCARLPTTLRSALGTRSGSHFCRRCAVPQLADALSCVMRCSGLAGERNRAALHEQGADAHQHAREGGRWRRWLPWSCF